MGCVAGRGKGEKAYVCAGVEEGLCAVDEPFRVARPGGLELLDRGVAAGTPSTRSGQWEREDGKKTPDGSTTYWMPTSGLGLRPCAAVNSMSEAQSSVGMDRKPEDSSRTSNLMVAVPL